MAKKSAGAKRRAAKADRLCDEALERALVNLIRAFWFEMKADVLYDKRKPDFTDELFDFDTEDVDYAAEIIRSQVVGTEGKSDEQVVAEFIADVLAVEFGKYGIGLSDVWTYNEGWRLRKLKPKYVWQPAWLVWRLLKRRLSKGW